ncbi:MAG: 3-dehydroquinate synthase [Xanthomonadales bacterium]|nr:3-dehydroquinate synthase [Xanthomonadales bacterium]
MPRVELELGTRGYPIDIGPGLVGDAARWQELVGDRTVLVLSNDVVAPLYLERACTAMEGAQVHTLVLPDGEQHKNAEHWRRVIDHLVNIRAGRDACLVTLGGGVIGDLGGFAAATYMRGIDFIQAPTTLLAQVDASVGGKTAINHPEGKNLVGAFHQPRAVLADTSTLETLPARHFRAGLAEVIKMAMIRDAEFLAWLEARSSEVLSQDAACLERVIETCVRHKAAVVAADEREAGERALLNFGHSFGHAIERLTDYRHCLHGEAVSIGMVIAATLSEHRGLCPTGVASRLADLLRAMGLPVTLPEGLNATDMLAAMQLDKKNLSGSLRLILVRDCGQAFIDSNSDPGQIREAIQACS